MDFLALTTLTIIDDTLKMLQQYERLDLNMDTLPLDDEKNVRAILSGPDRWRVPVRELGDERHSSEVQAVQRRTPDGAERTVPPRPHWRGMIDDFIKRKHGVKKIEYELPELTMVLEETYGVIVYQEQVMQIANIIAGYSLGEADLCAAHGQEKG